MTGVDAETRRVLAELASNSRTREAMRGPRKRWPGPWQPEEVGNPEDPYLKYFTEDTAWNFVVERLRQGHPMKRMTLNKPPGAAGYVMLVHLEDGAPRLYIKLAIARTRRKVFGRSFHYSTEKPRTQETRR